MGTSNLKRLQVIIAFGLLAFVALGVTAIQRGITEIVRFGSGTFRAVGPQVKQTRSVNDFDRVQAGGVYEVDITLGNRPSVVLEAPQDLLPHLTATVSNGTLDLGSNANFNLNGHARIKAHVVTRRLRGASISGAGKMVINGRIDEGAFDANASGAASLRLSASVDTFRLEASGAAKTNISSLGAHTLNVRASGAAECLIAGTVGQSKIDASGASDVKGGLTSGRAEVQTSGAAHAVLRVLNAISGEASGASSITFSGRPAQVDIHSTGVASVNRSS
jgi:hypothetical protein